MDCKAMKVQLPSGNYMPLIGFGTFQIRGSSLIKEVINHALAAGYRLIDTAAIYGNEADIGKALKELLPKYNLKRKDIFITSKLSPNNHGNVALTGLRHSIRYLGCDYLDLYLIHWPGAQGVPGNDPKNAKLRSESWMTLIKAVEQGLVKDIGVSNYTKHHLSEISNTEMKPAVNQVEWHPHYHDDELKKYCVEAGIFLQAYSSLGGSDNLNLLKDPIVIEVANKLNRSSAQVLLRWALQQNIGVIPKGRTKEHIETNIDLNFIIPVEHMEKLNNIRTDEKYAWDPNTVL